MFKISDVVVYPHHGVGSVEEKIEKVVQGNKVKYLVIKIAPGDMIVQVPEKKALEIGVEKGDKKFVERIFEVLRAQDEQTYDNWSQRFKAITDRLATGNVEQAAEVARDLWRYNKEGNELTNSEHKAYENALDIVAAGISLIQKTEDSEESRKLVLDVIESSSVS